MAREITAQTEPHAHMSSKSEVVKYRDLLSCQLYGYENAAFYRYYKGYIDVCTLRVSASQRIDLCSGHNLDDF